MSSSERDVYGAVNGQNVISSEEAANRRAFGQRVRQLRKLQKMPDGRAMTQRDLADKLGCDKRDISDIELGGLPEHPRKGRRKRKHVHLPTIDRLAFALGTTYASLLRKEGETVFIGGVTATAHAEARPGDVGS